MADEVAVEGRAKVSTMRIVLQAGNRLYLPVIWVGDQAR